MQKNITFITTLLLGAYLFITGCEPHRIDIQQGNRVNPEAFSQLKLGMTRNQVVYLLGTPLLKDPFHKSRWDYIYYLKPGNKDIKQSRLTLFFEDDLLSRIDDSEYTPEMHDDADTREITPEDAPPSL